MKIKCIDNTDCLRLTLGKEYPVLKETSELYFLINDIGKENPYSKYRFEVVEENSLQLEEVKKEMINHPSHYNKGKYEAIDIIEDWKLGFNLGNTVKYIARAGLKDDTLQDLKKALWYLNREITNIEKDRNNG